MHSLRNEYKFHLLACAVSLFALSLTKPANGTEIYKWIDDAGKANIGDIVPENYRSRATIIKIQSGPNQNQRADAIARHEKEQKLAAPPPSRVATPNSSPTVSSPSPPLAGLTACEKKFQEYRASQECFAPYRTKGGMKEEASQHCTVVNDPTFECGSRSDRTSSQR